MYIPPRQKMKNISFQLCFNNACYFNLKMPSAFHITISPFWKDMMKWSDLYILLFDFSQCSLREFRTAGCTFAFFLYPEMGHLINLPPAHLPDCFFPHPADRQPHWRHLQCRAALPATPPPDKRHHEFKNNNWFWISWVFVLDVSRQTRYCNQTWREKYCAVYSMRRDMDANGGGKNWILSRSLCNHSHSSVL